jgi:Zn finger protein HypA/HybF involved in hydrogenase expression
LVPAKRWQDAWKRWITAAYAELDNESTHTVIQNLRLADLLGMSHEEAANEMGVSRSTFSRLIVKSRKKIAEFFFQGKLLTVTGGNIHFRKNIIECSNCGHMFKTDIETMIKTCPVCGSNNLLSLAGGFGHGECCKIAYLEYNNKEK